MITRDDYESEKARILNDPRYSPMVRDWLLSELEELLSDEGDGDGNEEEPQK